MKAHSAKHPERQYDGSGEEFTFTEITRDVEYEKRVENTLKYQLEKMKRGEYSNGLIVSRAVETATNGPRKCSTDSGASTMSSDVEVRYLAMRTTSCGIMMIDDEVFNRRLDFCRTFIVRQLR